MTDNTKNFQKTRTVVHPFSPIVSKNSKILILGSVPSVKSVENNFFYMNKFNRFWKVLGALTGENFEHMDSGEKTNALIKHKIALYDAIYACEIVGSSDSKIKVVEYSNLNDLTLGTNIERIFANGDKAYQAIKKGNPNFLFMTEKLPSTSPANAAWSFEMLVQSWSVILQNLI